MELSSNSEEQLQDDLVLLHRVYPNLNRKQLLEAKENLDRYFDLAVRIFLRLEQEQNDDAFDTSEKLPKIQIQRSKISYPINH